MPFDVYVLIPLAGIALVGMLGLPVVRAVVAAIERKSAARGVGDVAGLRAELEEMRGRVEYLEEQGGRVAELEERLDFTERLLTQQREQALEPPPPEGKHAGNT